MRRALTASQMRAIDGASPALGVPTLTLMERAGEALARQALSEAGPSGRFLVVCGPGNNGGDGFVAARILAGQGRAVRLELIGEAAKLKGDAAENWKRLDGTGVVLGALSTQEGVSPGDVVVDALFGTGLTRAPEGAFAEAIGRIGQWRAKGAVVVSADLPSGLDGDTGQAFAPCVAADVTVTFGGLKVGLVVEPGVTRAGAVRVVELGFPPGAEAAASGPFAYEFERADVLARLPARRSDTHKGTYGHVLVVAGSDGKSGAAALAGLGALRGGAGLVTVAARSAALAAAQAHAPEVMGVSLPGQGPLGLSDLEGLLGAAEDKQVVVIGPGIPRGAETGLLLAALAERLRVPLIADADALNAIADEPGFFVKRRCPVVITPHPGEMARLTGQPTAAVQCDRLALARNLATRHSVTVVLKGARTLTASPDGTVVVNPTGNPGMATAGSGDVLAGLVGALVAQGLAVDDAARVGAWVHGRAGDVMAQRTGQAGLIASDLLEGLGSVWASLGR